MATNKDPLQDKNLETWYQQTVSKLYRFIYAQLQNREEAEDITQETYFRCLRHSKQDLPPYPYLKQVARNLIYDRYRQWQRFLSQAEKQSLTQSSSSDSSMEENWITQAYLQELMDQLPQEYRQVLKLRIIEGYSRKETAEQMGRSEDSIRGLQYRALQNLRDLIKSSDNYGG